MFYVNYGNSKETSISMKVPGLKGYYSSIVELCSDVDKMSLVDTLKTCMIVIVKSYALMFSTVVFVSLELENKLDASVEYIVRYNDSTNNTISTSERSFQVDPTKVVDSISAIVDGVEVDIPVMIDV